MNYYIYGAGGHGKVVLDAMRNAKVECAGFIDDRELKVSAGLNVYGTSSLECGEATYLHLAIGNCKTREKLAKSLHKFNFFSVIHPASVVARTSKVGVGSFLAALSIVAPDAKIGAHCIINHAAVVDHDCTVGDFVHVAPHVGLGGGVTIGNGVLIGSGAVVLPGLKIDDYAVIGAGAVVTKNVPAGTTVIGNPAKIFNKL